MSDLFTQNLEKRTRIVLWVIGILIILLYTIFRIGVPIVKGEPLYLDGNDGKVIAVTLGILLAYETVRAIIKTLLKKYSK